jgi:hypothetical protein
MAIIVGTETLKVNKTGFPIQIPTSDLRTFINPISTVLLADATASNVATVQSVFPTNGAFTALDRTLYKFEALYMITRAAGVTSHTTSILFGGTATLTSIDYVAEISNPTGNILSAASHIVANAATALVVTAANTSATENIRLRLTGIIRVNVGGTVIPQFQYSVAPGGAPTIKRNSYFCMTPVGNRDDVVAGVGWA